MTEEETQASQRVQAAECPYPDCDWSREYDANDYSDELAAEQRAVSHFDNVHRGDARVKVVLEKRVALHPAQDPSRLVDEELDRFEDGAEKHGYEAAYACIEVVEEPDELPEDGGDDG